jgi:hypothetical protein
MTDCLGNHEQITEPERGPRTGPRRPAQTRRGAGARQAHPALGRRYQRCADRRVRRAGGRVRAGAFGDRGELAGLERAAGVGHVVVLGIVFVVVLGIVFVVVVDVIVGFGDQLGRPGVVDPRAGAELARFVLG